MSQWVTDTHALLWHLKVDWEGTAVLVGDEADDGGVEVGGVFGHWAFLILV